MSSQSLRALALLLLGAMPAVAQPAAPDTASTLQRGERLVLLASPLFTNDNLGHAYEEDLDGLRSRPVVDAPSNAFPEAVELMPKVNEQIRHAKAGEATVVAA